MSARRSGARRLVGRAARWGAREGWMRIRPGRTTDVAGRLVGVVGDDGSPPQPDQRWVPATTPTGPWADVDPLVAPAWPSRTSAVASVLVWGVVGLRVRRAWVATADGGAEPDGSHAGSGGSAAG